MISATTDALWRPLELVGGWFDDEGVHDVACYLLSRGPAAWDAFVAEWRLALAELHASGAVAAVRRTHVTVDGRPASGLDDVDLELHLGSVLLGGRTFHALLLRDPELTSMSGPVSEEVLDPVDLLAALEAVRPAAGAGLVAGADALWDERPGDRDRAGDLWLGVSHVSHGPGLAWETVTVLDRMFWRAAHEDDYRRLRDRAGVRAVDLQVNHGEPEPELHQDRVVRGRLEITVDRPLAVATTPQERAAAGRADGELLLALVRAALSGRMSG